MNSKKLKVAVIGQGYVGLPLAIACSIHNFIAFGVDKNAAKIHSLKNGTSAIEDVKSSDIKNSLNSGSYIPTTDIAKAVSQSEIILICVPTPLTTDRRPDFGPLIEASKEVGRNLTQDKLVILESTVEPGTTRNLMTKILAEYSGLSVNQLKIVFSPERIDPANNKWTLKNTPKLIAGLTPEAAMEAKEFYSSFIDEVHICSSVEVAETAKLLENSFRLVNISFINEITIFCQKIGIDILEVIRAASTKPYGFMPFYPGIGVGGHCIPVDPLYLAEAAKAAGSPSRFIELADEINLSIPTYYVGKASEILGGLNNKKILVIGISYKPNISDTRETPVEALIAGLRKSGAQVSWHDEIVGKWQNEESCKISSDYDLAILATSHDYLDLSNLGNVPMLNTRGSI